MEAKDDMDKDMDEDNYEIMRKREVVMEEGNKREREIEREGERDGERQRDGEGESDSQ